MEHEVKVNLRLATLAFVCLEVPPKSGSYLQSLRQRLEEALHDALILSWPMIVRSSSPGQLSQVTLTFETILSPISKKSES